MKVVAALMAVALAMLLTACPADQSAVSTSTVTPPAPRAAEPPPIATVDNKAPALPAEGSVPAGSASPDSPATASPGLAPDAKADASLPPPAPEPEVRADETAPPPVRDAKEAAEDAARKILDATVGAAEKLKEVGRSAVQSVRDTVAPATGPAPVSEAAPASESSPAPGASVEPPPASGNSLDKAN